METILAMKTMELLEGVKVETKAKKVRVTSPRGMLTRNFDFQQQDGGHKLKLDAWFGTSKMMAVIRTTINHVNNLITDVTQGYMYKMRFLYEHFPINASIGANGDNIEILDKKKVHKVKMLPGVTVT